MYLFFKRQVLLTNNEFIGFAGVADDGKPYTAAGYANGPGFEYHRVANNTVQPRLNLTEVDTSEFSVSVLNLT